MSEPKKMLWEDSFRVRAYEAGPDGRVTIQHISNYLQEAASNHALALGVFAEKLNEIKATWVMSRLHVKMFQYPFWKQAVRIETWPAERDHFYAIRDYRVYDEKNREIGVATSSWMMIDIHKRRPIELPAFVDDLKNEQAGRALVDSFERLPKPERADSQKYFNVRLSDLDINQHVNSVNYIDWGLEAVPQAIWKSHRLSDMEINYRAESVYGDRILSLCQIEEKGSQVQVLHKLVREKDEKELTRMRSSWVAK